MNTFSLATNILKYSKTMFFVVRRILINPRGLLQIVRLFDLTEVIRCNFKSVHCTVVCNESIYIFATKDEWVLLKVNKPVKASLSSTFGNSFIEHSSV